MSVKNIVYWTAIFINRALKKHYSKMFIEENYDLFIKVFDKTYEGMSQFEYEQHSECVSRIVPRFIEILYSNRKFNVVTVFKIMTEPDDKYKPKQEIPKLEDEDIELTNLLNECNIYQYHYEDVCDYIDYEY